MAATTYVRPRGSTITIALLDAGASTQAAPLVTSYARPLLPNRKTVDPNATPVRFLPQYRAADSNFGAGWFTSLDAGACAALAARDYGLDLKIQDGQGAAVICAFARLTIIDPATTLPTIVPATVTYPDPTGLVAPFTGVRTIAWIPDAPLIGPVPAAIVGPPGAPGSGSGGGMGLPVSYTVTTGGQQTFAFAGAHALVFLGALWQPPSLFNITGGNLILSATAGAASGDVITAYPLS